MATIFQPLLPEEAQFLAANFPQFVKLLGTNFPVAALAFDATTEESAFYKVKVVNFANSPVLRIAWGGDTATTGDVVWGCQFAAITPDVDTADVTTKALAAAQTVTDSHLGTTARRIMQANLTITNTDSLANLDWLWLRIYRDADAGGDTMVGDALFYGATLEHSDT